MSLVSPEDSRPDDSSSVVSTPTAAYNSTAVSNSLDIIESMITTSNPASPQATMLTSTVTQKMALSSAPSVEASESAPIAMQETMLTSTTSDMSISGVNPSPSTPGPASAPAQTSDRPTIGAPGSDKASAKKDSVKKHLNFCTKSKSYLSKIRRQFIKAASGVKKHFSLRRKLEGHLSPKNTGEVAAQGVPKDSSSEQAGSGANEVHGDPSPSLRDLFRFSTSGTFLDIDQLHQLGRESGRFMPLHGDIETGASSSDGISPAPVPTATGGIDRVDWAYRHGNQQRGPARGATWRHRGFDALNADHPAFQLGTPGNVSRHVMFTDMVHPNIHNNHGHTESIYARGSRGRVVHRRAHSTRQAGPLHLEGEGSTGGMLSRGRG